MNAEMINDRQKVYNNIINNNNTDSNNDNNNKNNSFRHLSQRANNNNNYSKSSSSSAGAGRDKFSVTNSFRRYTCQQCDKIFTDPSVLHHHFRSAHSSSSSRSHSCPECSKNFASSSGLKQHQHIHQSVKPFRCEVCLKAYTQFSNLCRHKRMHADCRQQIKCLDCGQAFSTLMSLNKHRRFCEGVMRRHSSNTAGPGLNPATCFLPGLDGAGSIVTPGAAAAASALQAIHPSLGALESWCMHLYGCRPSAFPVCPPAGYMACLPPFPSQQSMLAAAAAAAQSSPLLLGSYMGLLPLQEEGEEEQPGRKEGSASSLIRRPSSSASSTAEKRRRSRERKAVNHREGQSSVTTSAAYETPIPEVERQETWPLEDLGRSVKKEKEEEVKEELTKETSMEEEVDKKNLRSPSEDSHAERKTSGSPLIRTPSPDDTGSVEDQQPLDLSTKSRVEVKSPLTGTSTFTSRLDPLTSSAASRSRSATFEDSLRRPTGNDAKHPPPSKHPRYSLEPSSFVPGTGFLSSVYHLRKDLLASYAGRDSSTVHPNGTYQLTTARPELDNIRGFVGKADHGLHQSTLLSPLVRLPDILSFKSTKPRYRYSCRYCGKVFPRSANLTRHLRTHTGEQPYRCKYCKRCFSISSNLQRHVRNIHNKEKPFRCPLCERCFGQQTNLDRHVKKHDTDPCTGGGETSPCFPSGPGYPGAAGGSRGSGAHDVKGVVGMRQDEPYFKEIQNYFANTSSSSSSFYLGRVEGQVDEVTGSGEKEKEEVEGEGGAGEGKVEVKTEADDSLQ